jgi:hypothetical protein
MGPCLATAASQSLLRRSNMQIAKSLTDSSSGTLDLQWLVQELVQQHQQQQEQAQLATHGAEASLETEITRAQKILQRFSRLASVMLKLAGTWEVLGSTTGIILRTIVLLRLRSQLSGTMRQYLLRSQCMQERQLVAAAAATPRRGWGQQQQLVRRRRRRRQ